MNPDVVVVVVNNLAERFGHQDPKYSFQDDMLQLQVKVSFSKNVETYLLKCACCVLTFKQAIDERMQTSEFN